MTKLITEFGKWMVTSESDADHVLLKTAVRPVTIRHLLGSHERIDRAVRTPAVGRFLYDATTCPETRWQGKRRWVMCICLSATAHA